MGKGWFPEQHQGTGAGWKEGDWQAKAEARTLAGSRVHAQLVSLTDSCTRMSWCAPVPSDPVRKGLYCSLSPLVVPWAVPSPSLL